MTATGKSISIVVLSYFLFGIFNLFQFGQFVVPITYVELFVFVLTLVGFAPHFKGLTKVHYTFLGFATLGVIIHPFFWEIFLDQQAQFSVQNNIIFDILRITQCLILALFFLLVSYNKAEHKLKIEWLLPCVLSLGLLLNPPSWYTNMLFILSGFSAFYTLRKRTIAPDFLMEVLIGIGVVCIINCFI